jgi:hypothetical protein
MTIVELMVSTLVLAVGILGTVSMIDTSNATTTKNKAREGATNLGRAVLEVARAVPYKDLSAEKVYEELARHPGLEDADEGKPGHQIASRNFTYEIAVDVCSLDDAKDRLGDHDEAIVFCADTDVRTGAETSVDRNPDDYRRVALTLSWRASRSDATTRQTGIITNPVGGLGPSIVTLEPDTPPVTTIDSDLAVATYRATTSVSASEVHWSIDGDDKGKATGGPVDWSFSWNLVEERADGTLRYPDCTYVLGALGFDDKDRSGAAKALTIKLNRIAPVAPRQFQGGRNLNGTRVDLQWEPNRECDITSYEVYRGTSPDSASINTLVCDTPPDVTECVDETAPAPAAGQTLYYKVLATDTSPSLTERPGTPTSALEITEGNTPPTAPGTLAICVGGNPGCNDIDGNAAPAGTYSLSWDASTDADGIYFYRVYRKSDATPAPSYQDRYDILFPVSGKPLVFVDDQPLTGPSSYWVSAVDSTFGESALTGPVTVTP